MVWIALMLIGLISANIQSSVCFSGENIWQLANDVCAMVESNSSLIDDLQTCLVSTSITQADVSNTGYIISTPGNYILCESITTTAASAITITANDVYLNLNGHTITSTGTIGITCTGNQNIKIANGIITQGATGINITGTTYIELNDLTIFTCTTNGIRVNNTNHATIDCCLCENMVNGFFLDLSDDVVIKNSTSSGCTNCFLINNGATNFIMESCIASECTLTGFSLLIDGAVLKNCIATTIPGAIGFFALDSANVDFISCIATRGIITNSIGFSINSSINILLRDCSGTYCGTGFSISGTSSQVVLDGCIANGNSGSGIDNTSVASSIFIVDTRSQHAATTPTGLNPAYNLNGAVDVSGSAVIIVTS